MLAMAALNFAYSAELVQGYSASRPESYKITFFSLATKAANKTTCKTGFSQKKNQRTWQILFLCLLVLTHHSGTLFSISLKQL